MYERDVTYVCVENIYSIICKPNMATLCQRNELVSTCRHASKFLLKGSMLVHAAVFKLIQESDNLACVR